jgi:hypothetical protein
MNSKQVIMTTTIIGSTIGSCIPLLWNASFLSLWSIFLTAIGGFAGIYIGYKMTV